MAGIEALRGMRNEWVDIAICPICGAIYMDCAISAAQRMHDEDDDGEGCAGRVVASPEKIYGRGATRP